MIAEVPPNNRHLLLAEGGCCIDYPEEDDRAVLAIGQEARRKGACRHGLALRQEVLAGLWAAVLTGRGARLRPGCRLYRLPCRWPGAGRRAAKELELTGSGLGEVTALIDWAWLLRPEGIVTLAVGDNPDDSYLLAGLVGSEERTGALHAFLWHQEYVERLWQALLLGPGACFASPGGPLWRAFGLGEGGAAGTGEDGGGAEA
jgi:hypothetical protein